MGEGSAFVAGGLVGGAVGASAGYQAGYNQRDAEMQPYINQLLSQIGTLNSQLQAKERRISELESQLKANRNIPVISDIRRKLSGSQ